LYFNHKPAISTIEHQSVENTETTVVKENHTRPLQLLWSHFRSAYTNPLVLQWSLWYAIGLAGYLQVTTYMQVVWKSFENEPTVSKGLLTHLLSNYLKFWYNFIGCVEWRCGCRPNCISSFICVISRLLACRTFEITCQFVIIGHALCSGRWLRSVSVLDNKYIFIISGLRAFWRTLRIYHNGGEVSLIFCI